MSEDIQLIDKCLEVLKLIKHKQVNAAMEHLIMYKQEVQNAKRMDGKEGG